MWVGTFAVIMMIYLFLAPKLVKKPSGTPPRAGSNQEKVAMQQAAGGGVPALNLGGGVGGPVDFPARRGFNIEPGMSPAEAGGSDISFKLGQAYRARRRARRARRAFRGIRSRARSLNMFPFANLAIS